MSANNHKITLDGLLDFRLVVPKNQKGKEKRIIKAFCGKERIGFLAYVQGSKRHFSGIRIYEPHRGHGFGSALLDHYLLQNEEEGVTCKQRKPLVCAMLFNRGYRTNSGKVVVIGNEKGCIPIRITDECFRERFRDSAICREGNYDIRTEIENGIEVKVNTQYSPPSTIFSPANTTASPQELLHPRQPWRA